MENLLISVGLNTHGEKMLEAAQLICQSDVVKAQAAFEAIARIQAIDPPDVTQECTLSS